MDNNLLIKIEDAHKVGGVKRNLSDYLNILSLLEVRAVNNKKSIFIKYYLDDDREITHTYDEFYKKVRKLTDFFIYHGLNYEDRIATFLHNHIDTVVLYYAAWSLGITVVPLNLSEDDSRIKYILKNADIKSIFTLTKYHNRLINIENNISIFNFDEINYPVTSAYDNYISKTVSGETEALIVYTSGTTGNPKGVVLTQENLLTDAKYISEWHKLNSGDVMMCVLPIHHVNGIIVTLLTPMYYGGTVILNQKFHSHKFFELIKTENVKVVSVVPTILQYLIHSQQNNTKYSLNSLSHIICGAGPLTSELAKNFESKFNIRIIHGYGLSETTCYSCFVNIDLPEDEHKKWQNDFGFPSIGIPLGCNEMDIQDEDGNSKKEGERGEIVIRGSNVMKYYFKNDEANESAFKNGWFRSGDEGFFKYYDKGNKYYFITGRIKELIIRGGVNISPFEIDEVLSSIKYIKSGVAVGFENDWYGEEIGAVVILKNEFINNDTETIKTNILKECRNKLPEFKSPKVVIFTDEIPVTSTGKYQRNKMKHLFQEYKKIQFR